MNREPSGVGRRCLLASAIVLAWLFGGEARGQSAPPIAELGLGPAQVRNLEQSFPDRRGQIVRSQQATFTLDKLRYAIKYSYGLDTLHGDKLFTGEGYLGMPLPASCNWYHSGFLFILINGQDIGTRSRASSVVVAERGSRAILDVVWHDELADVRARFLALPGHDHLDCEIAIDPRQPVNSVALRLACYPSYFTSANQRNGARRIQTPAALITQGQRVKAPAKDHWWAVYYDEIFDVALGEGEGPCGLMLVPEEPTEIAFEPGGYGVSTRITYPAQTRRMHLALWDFKGRTNAETLAGFRQAAARTRQELTRLDFTPTAVRGVNLGQLRSEVQQALQAPAIRAALGKQKTAEIEAWLAEYTPVEPGRPASAIASEEQLLHALDKYHDFSWEVKMAELLSRL